MALAGAAAVALFMLLAPASSQARDPDPSSCDPTAVTDPFAIFGDPSDYSLVQGGDFESGAAGWSLDDAQIVSGNESYYVNGESDSSSLLINRHGRAVSPSFCVDTSYPHLRFFARSLDRPQGQLTVRARWHSGNRMKERTLGTVKIDKKLSAINFDTWRASEQVPLASKVDVNRPGDTGIVQLVFTTSGDSGDWLIDDVYVDPYRR
jgi:hypothetical protein